MPAEAELREALYRLAANAPDADEALDSLLARVDGPAAEARRPRFLAATAAVAAVLIIVVALAAVLGDDGGRRAPVRQTPVRPVLVSRAALVPAWHFRTAPVAGVRIVRDTFLRVGPVTWVQESASVTAVHGRESGRIVVQEHSPGGWPPQLAQQLTTSGRRTSVDHRPAYFTYGRRLVADAADPWAAAAADPDHQPELIWQLPDGAWAMVSGTFGFRPATRDWNQSVVLADLRKLAGAVHYGARTSVTLPFGVVRGAGALVPATVREFPESSAYCLGYATIRGRAVSIDGKGAAVLMCRSAAAGAAVGRYRQLVANSPVLASRPLPDGGRLVLLGTPSTSGLSAAGARVMLAKADVAPALRDSRTWLPVR